MEKINLFYFSGSGNTEKIANHVKKFFEEKGFETSLEKMEKIERVNIDDCEYVGLLFPVAIQSTFPLVWNFAKKLPTTQNKKIFMIDTMEAFSGGIVGPLKKVLSKKGYNCVGALEIKMSNSMQTNIKKVDKGISLNQKAYKKAEDFCQNLLAGKTKWHRIIILSDLMRSISVSKNIWISQSKKLTVNNDKCISCGLCIRKCPKQALSYIPNTKKITIDHTLCESCMRCVNHCPKNAFLLDGKQVIQNK